MTSRLSSENMHVIPVFPGRVQCTDAQGILRGYTFGARWCTTKTGSDMGAQIAMIGQCTLLHPNRIKDRVH